MITQQTYNRCQQIHIKFSSHHLSIKISIIKPSPLQLCQLVIHHTFFLIRPFTMTIKFIFQQTGDNRHQRHRLTHTKIRPFFLFTTQHTITTHHQIYNLTQTLSLKHFTLNLRLMNQFLPYIKILIRFV